MDRNDWLLAIGVTFFLGLAFYFLLPPYGWIGGVGLAVFILYRGKKRRDLDQIQ